MRALGWLSPGVAVLCVFDHEQGDSLVYEANVTLMHGATFVADSQDKRAWTEKVEEFVKEQAVVSASN